MSLLNRHVFSDLRGATRLAVEATVGVTELVENMHHTIQLGHAPLGSSRAGKTGGLTGVIYGAIRGTTQLVGLGLDAGIAPLSKLLPEGEAPAKRDALVSAINGLHGDHLEETHNPLAIQMEIRSQARVLDIQHPEPELASAQQAQRGKLILFIHGLCLNETHWTRDGHNRGEVLATQLGFLPLYLRYNTGLNISENGRRLAAMLEELLAAWPDPVDELVIIGHSMGGLVAKSACYFGREEEHTWLKHLHRLVFIGSPHHGAPLEKGGAWLSKAMELSPYSLPFTRIAETRSAGINDLKQGCTTGIAGFSAPLPAEVECYAMAGSLSGKPGRIHQRLIGDGLVPVDSALGQNSDPGFDLGIPASHQWLGYQTGHLALLGSGDVYAQLREWLA